MLIPILLLLGGLALLYFGAEWLVKGSASLALRLGVSPIIIGLTIVAAGTSAPELVISIGAGLEGRGDIALGNVIGSNIFNIAVILGLSGLVRPITVHRQVVRLDIPIMIALSGLFSWMVSDSGINRVEALVLLAGFIGYCTMTILLARKNPDNDKIPSVTVPRKGGTALDFVHIIAGFAGLVIGSRTFVNGAVTLAELTGISEAVVGLTIVAAGTSLPELATSIVAAGKKQDDIAVGNIVGSNLFNILGIVGISGTIAPLQARGIGILDVGVMMTTSIIILPFLLPSFRLNRIHSVVLLSIYGVYMFLLWPR